MVKTRRHPTSCWSNISQELIFSISQLLSSPSDILSFRGVCKKWRKHSSPLPPNILNPLLPHPIPTFHCQTLKLANSNSSTLVIAARSIYQFNNNLTSWLVMAEEVNPGKIQLRHPLSGKLLSHSATTLDLSHFEVSELSKGYNLLNSKLSVVKVLLHSESASTMLSLVNDPTAFVMYNPGIVGALGLALAGSKHSWHEYIYIFDDIVIFKGVIAVIDCIGTLFEMDNEFNPWLSLLLKQFLAKGLDCSDIGFRRLRLVFDPLSDRLYLVLRIDWPQKLCVYVLNEQHKKWEIVKSFGRYRVLFVGIDQCFFASARDFPGCPGIGNSIIFTDNAFPENGTYRSISSDRSLFHGADEEERIRVFKLTKEEGFNTISDYPGLSQLMKPPLEWFLGSREETKKDEETHSDANSQDELGVQTIETPSTPTTRERLTRAGIPSSVISELGLAEMASASTTRERVTRMSTITELEHAVKEDSHPETLREEINITHSVSRGYITSTTQSNKSDNSTVNFEGLNTRSDVLQTLQNIWSKHGNLIENSIIRTGDIVARALESLATAVLILEETSVRSLSDSQADYLKSTLSDLQCMHFKVDWLVPCVEKAVQLHKSKPLIDSCHEILRCQAKVIEQRAKLMEEVAELDKLENEMKEDVVNASRLIGNVDLDQPVGWGSI